VSPFSKPVNINNGHDSLPLSFCLWIKFRPTAYSSKLEIASLRLFRRGKKEENNKNRATIKAPAAMGRLKNIEKLPSDMMRDCRSAFSSMGVSIKARTRGAGSYLNFLNR
jgi:hypothetical protein